MSKHRSHQLSKRRSLTLEPLEERQMLSVTPADFAAIKEAYSDLGLTTISDYNVIEINSTDLTEASLKNAIAQAATSNGNDLVVIHTSEENHAITLTSGELNININAQLKGGITIVSYGAERLTIDALQQSRVFNLTKSDVALAGLNLTGGYANDDNGGAINMVGGNLTVTESSLTNNYATYGGAGLAVTSAGHVTITSTQIIANETDLAQGTGAGIFAYTAQSIAVRNSVVSDNVGNGIYSIGVTRLTIDDSVFNNNVGTLGGAISVKNGELAASNSLVTNNIATSRGGGIYVENAANKVFDTTIVNCTITGNITLGTANNTTGVGNGGGLYVKNGSTSSVLTVNNTIIADNGATGTGKDVFLYQGTSIVGFNNLIGNGANTNLINGINDNMVGTVNSPINPKFADAASGNYRLAKDSLAIDAGNNSLARDTSGNLITTDLAGKTRVTTISNNRVDIGAYEFQAYNEWLGVTDSSWLVDSNWSYGHMPMLDETVLIPEGTSVDLTLDDMQSRYDLAAATIICDGTFVIDAMTSYRDYAYFPKWVNINGELNVSGSLVLNAGELHLHGGGEITGSLYAAPGNSLIVQSIDYTMSGNVNIDGAYLGAYGAVFSLPGLTSYVATEGQTDLSFCAGNKLGSYVGAAGALDLSQLKTITNNTGSDFLIYADGGSVIDLSGLKRVTGNDGSSLTVYAKANSYIDLIGLQKLNGIDTVLMAGAKGKTVDRSIIDAGNLTVYSDNLSKIETNGGMVFLGEKADYVVSTLADVVDGDHSAGNLSLREALQLAAVQPGANTIAFDPDLFVDANWEAVAKKLHLQLGELVVNSEVQITGPGNELLTITAGGMSRVMSVIDAGNVDISGMRFADGNDVESGGGIYLENANLSLDDVIIYNCTSSFAGGAFYQASGLLNVTNTSFFNNGSNNGAGLYIDGGTVNLMNNVYFLYNTAARRGGGIYLSTGTLNALDVSFLNNHAGTTGGAVFQSGGMITLDNAAFIANTSDSGAAICQYGGTTELISPIFFGNVSGGIHGDALVKRTSATTILRQSNSEASSSKILGPALAAYLNEADDWFNWS